VPGFSFFLTLGLTTLWTVGLVEAAPEGFALLADRSGVAVPADPQPASKTFFSPWEPGEEDTARGFAACTVETSDQLTPDWLWPEPAPLQRLDLFACPGQYQAAAVAVRTLRPVLGLTPMVSDLRTASGASLGRENVDVRLVQYVHRQDREVISWEGPRARSGGSTWAASSTRGTRL